MVRRQFCKKKPQNFSLGSLCGGLVMFWGFSYVNVRGNLRLSWLVSQSVEIMANFLNLARDFLVTVGRVLAFIFKGFRVGFRV